MAQQPSETSQNTRSSGQKRLEVAARDPQTGSLDILGQIWLDGKALKAKPAPGKASALTKMLAFYRARGAGRGMDDATFFRTLPSRISYQMGSCAWVKDSAKDSANADDSSPDVTSED